MLHPPRLSEPSPIRLNPDYFVRHAVLPLDCRDDRLVLGMADPGDTETIAALSLATGYTIEAVTLSAERIASAFDAAGAGPGAPDWTLRPAALARPGLAAARRRIRWRARRSAAFLLPLTELLDAGCDPVDAAGILALSERAGERVDPALRALAARLAAGTSLEQALGDAREVPPWVQVCIAGCSAPGGPAAVLHGIASAEQAAAEWGRGHPRLAIEAAVWAFPIGLVWGAGSVEAGLSIGMAALALLARIGWLLGAAPRANLRQAEALALTSALARLGAPPADALRAGAARGLVDAAAWRELPHSRAQLAGALGLLPLPTALLLRGDLTEAAARAAAHCARSSARLAARRRWQVHALGLVAACVALAAFSA